VPDLSSFHLWFVFVHVVGVLLFMLAHGVSAAVMLRLRRERDPGAVRTLLGLSRWTLGLALIGLLIWLITGVLAGFSGNYWTTGTYWIWASLVLAIVVSVVMSPMGRVYVNRVQEAVGVNEKTGAVDPAFVVDPARLESAIASGRPELLAAIGLGSVVVLTWLMMFKPF
jgi:hypothetical protein